MAAHPKAKELAELTNALSLSTSASLLAEVNRISREHGPEVGVTIAFDAALTAAVAVLDSAVFHGAVELTEPRDKLMHRRLDYILSLRDRFHQRRPDGSYDPAGQAIN